MTPSDTQMAHAVHPTNPTVSQIGRRHHLLPHLLKPRALRLGTLNIRRDLRLPALQPLVHPKDHELNLLDLRYRPFDGLPLLLRLLLIRRVPVCAGATTGRSVFGRRGTAGWSSWAI